MNDQVGKHTCSASVRMAEFVFALLERPSSRWQPSGPSPALLHDPYPPTHGRSDWRNYSIGFFEACEQLAGWCSYAQADLKEGR